MASEEQKVSELRNIVDKLEQDIKLSEAKEANKNQGKKLEKEKESMMNMFKPIDNYYDSIVENINYTECVNGKCTSIDIQNSNPLKNNLVNYNIDKYNTSSILKNNLDNLVYIIFIIVVAICFVQVFVNKKKGYLITILISSLVFIFYKIVMG